MVFKSTSSAIKLSSKPDGFVLVLSALHRNKDLILFPFSCDHLEAANLAIDYKNILLPEQELNMSGREATEQKSGPSFKVTVYWSL